MTESGICVGSLELSKPDFLLEFIYSSPVSNRTVDLVDCVN